MEDVGITSKIIQFFMQKIIMKLDQHKLKKYADLIFIFIEKTLVNFDKLYDFYFDFYSEMIKNEITLAGITKNNKIIHVGCGPIPATSILLAKKTGATITGLDKDSKSVKKANLCVSKMGLSNKIQIINKDVNNFSFKIFDIIIISQGVKPIKDILNQIIRSMKDKAYVIYRTTSLPNGNISQEDQFIKEIFTIDKIIPQKKNALLISILLSKMKT
jgi:cyclopropane fatty-acyl-phospholipid synthase-like methyltransferase